MAFYEEEDDLKRALTRAEQDHDSLQQALKQMLLLYKDIDGYRVDTLNPAGPGGRIEPRFASVIPTILMGLLCGVGLSYLAEMSDKSFHSPAEIRRRLGLPILGHIAAFNPDAATSPDFPNLDASLCVGHRTKSMESEAFRGLRTSVAFSTRGTSQKIIQVTSPVTGDGKSTLAANLALSLAQSGKSVLLIDADCRRPRQHKLFKVNARQGIATVLQGECEPDDAIQPTGAYGLAIMPCGPRPENPGELLTLPRFSDLLEVLRPRYDYIIVDTPPLLAVSDPSVVASRVDGVLLVVRLTKNARPAAERATEMLHSIDANVLGIAVNGIGSRGAKGTDGGSYGYGYYGNYGYGYYGSGYSYQYAYPYQASYTADTESDAENKSVDNHVLLNSSGSTTDTNGHLSEGVRRRTREKPGIFRWLMGLWK